MVVSHVHTCAVVWVCAWLESGSRSKVCMVLACAALTESGVSCICSIILSFTTATSPGGESDAADAITVSMLALNETAAAKQSAAIPLALAIVRH